MVRWRFLLSAGCLLFSVWVHAFGATNGLHVVPGFKITTAAAAPAIQFPMFGTIDERGRLFVAESSGLDLYAEITAGTRKCRVSVLRDRDQDGAYEEATVFADKLVFPMGLVAREGKLYVADPPELITLEDTNADGRADKRTVILSGFGHKDNGSLHGLTFGPDGWLYMTMGAPDGYRLKRADGEFVEGKSGALIRCKPDGSSVEVVARGFENLVEVVFTHTGEMIGSDNWFRRPEGDGLRDALVHLVEGGLYPLNLKDEGTAFPRTGLVLPPIAMFPAVAVSGLQLYAGNHFPPEMRRDIFSAQHNTRKVVRHKLLTPGATFGCTSEDFVWADDPDFHPSDVLEDRDGTLLVLDTGSWYVHHCPTGKIRQAPSKGAIYRVTHATNRKGSQPAALPKTISEIETALKGATGAVERCELIFALGRVGGEKALQTVREYLRQGHADETIAAAHVLARARDTNSAPRLLRLLSSNARPDVQRAAIEALASCGDREIVAELFTLYSKRSPDEFLQHAYLYGVNAVASDEQLLSFLQNETNASIKRAALQLLDQPGKQSLEMDFVLRLVESPELREKAVEVLVRRPQWHEAGTKLIAANLEAGKIDQLKPLMAAFGQQPTVQQLLATHIDQAAAPGKLSLVGLLREVPLRSVEPSLARSLFHSLRTGSEQVQMAILRWPPSVRIREIAEQAKRIANDPEQPNRVRIEAVRLTLSQEPVLRDTTFRFLLDHFQEAPQSLDRLTAGELLKRAALTDRQLMEILRTDNPLIRPESFLLSFKTVSGTETAEELVRELPSRFAEGSSLSTREIGEFIKQLPPALRSRAEKALTSSSGLEAKRERLRKFAPLLLGGKAESGNALFYGAKAGCSSCHAVNHEGGRAGPDLSKVGSIRSGQDLLESILFPSATFAQGFEPYLAVTADGREFSGSLVRHAEERSVLRDAAGNETELHRDELKELRRLSLSLMPEGLESALSESELRDLLAYLQSLK